MSPVLYFVLAAYAAVVSSHPLTDSTLGLNEVVWLPEHQAFVGSPSLIRLDSGVILASHDKFTSGPKPVCSSPAYDKPNATNVPHTLLKSLPAADLGNELGLVCFNSFRLFTRQTRTQAPFTSTRVVTTAPHGVRCRLSPATGLPSL